MPKILPQAFAYVFPLKRNLIERIFSREKVIIAKFFPRYTSSTRFRKGTIVLFYESRNNKKILGQGIVLNSFLMDAQKIIRSYSESFFLKESELNEYVDLFPGRTNKKLVVLQLGDIRRFKNPIPCPKRATMAGMFLEENEYNSIMKND